MGSFPKQMFVANAMENKPVIRTTLPLHIVSVIQYVSALTELDQLLFFVHVYQGIHATIIYISIIVDSAQATLDTHIEWLFLIHRICMNLLVCGSMQDVLPKSVTGGHVCMETVH